jgi:hypothetical protein
MRSGGSRQYRRVSQIGRRLEQSVTPRIVATPTQGSFIQTDGEIWSGTGWGKGAILGDASESEPRTTKEE